MKVNGISNDEAIEYIHKSFNIWSKRSKSDWKLNIDYLEEFKKD